MRRGDSFFKEDRETDSISCQKLGVMKQQILEVKSDLDDWRSFASRMRESRQSSGQGVSNCHLNPCDFPRAMRLYDRKMLDAYQIQFSSADWAQRKRALDDYLDLISEHVAAALQIGDGATMHAFLTMLGQNVIHLLADDHAAVRDLASEAFARMATVTGETKYFCSLLATQIACSKSDDVRLSAVKTVLSLKPPIDDPVVERVVESLLLAIRDDNWRIRDAAQNALLKYARPKDIKVIRSLVGMIESTSAVWRTTALSLVIHWMEREAIHDGLTDQQIAEKIFASLQGRQNARELFEALDENGNKRLSVREFRMGIRSIFKVELSIRRLKSMLGKLADKDMTFDMFVGFFQSRVDSPSDASGAIEPEDTAERVADELLDEILSSLPAPCNPTDWLLESLVVGHRRERDDRLSQRFVLAFVHLAPISNRHYPMVLARELERTRGCGPKFRAVLEMIIEVAEDVGLVGNGNGKGKAMGIAARAVRTAAGGGGDRVGELQVTRERWNMVRTLCTAIQGPLSKGSALAASDSELDEELALALQALQVVWDTGAAAAALQARCRAASLQYSQKVEDQEGSPRPAVRPGPSRSRESSPRPAVRPQAGPSRSRESSPSPAVRGESDSEVVMAGLGKHRWLVREGGRESASGPGPGGGAAAAVAAARGPATLAGSGLAPSDRGFPQQLAEAEEDYAEAMRTDSEVEKALARCCAHPSDAVRHCAAVVLDRCSGQGAT